MREPEIEAFPDYLVVDGHVSAGTKNQAFNALLFPYSQILEIELGTIHSLKSREKRRRPTMLSRREAMAVPNLIDGVFHLAGRIP